MTSENEMEALRKQTSELIRHVQHLEEQIEAGNSKSLPQWAQWLMPAMGTIALFLLGWIGTIVLSSFASVNGKVETLGDRIASVTTDLAVVASEIKNTSPRMVLAEVNKRPTPDEVRRLIVDTAPWKEVEKDWEQWQREINAELERRTADRYTKTDHAIDSERMDKRLTAMEKSIAALGQKIQELVDSMR